MLQSHPCGAGIFVLQRRMKHSWIIRGKHDGYSMAEESQQWMIFDSRIFTSELLGEGARPEVASWADLERDFSFRKQVHQ